MWMKLKKKCKGSGEGKKKKKMDLQLTHTTDTMIRILKCYELNIIKLSSICIDMVFIYKV